MSAVLWQTEHSVEADATPSFAWSYLTNIANWNDPPAEFELDGAFAAGARGVTRMPGQEPRYWFLAEVTSGKSYTMQTSIEGAEMLFQWSFDELADGRTRLTQRIVLRGDNAPANVEQVQAAFTSTLAAGMTKIAECIGQAQTTAQERRS